SPSGGSIRNSGVWNFGDGAAISNNGGQDEFRNVAGGVVNKIGPPNGSLANWSAEDGPASNDGSVVASIPSWNRTSNFTVVLYGSPSFPTAAQAPPGAGNAFFAGGPNTPQSTIFQDINVSAFAGSIDAGEFTSQLEGWLGGVGTNDSAMTVNAIYLNGATELGRSTLQPVLAADRGNVTGFVFRTANATVPPGTRTV